MPDIYVYSQVEIILHICIYNNSKPFIHRTTLIDPMFLSPTYLLSKLIEFFIITFVRIWLGPYSTIFLILVSEPLVLSVPLTWYYVGRNIENEVWNTTSISYIDDEILFD